MSRVISLNRHKFPGRRAVCLTFLDHDGGQTVIRISSEAGTTHFAVPTPVADDLEKQLEDNPGSELVVLLDFLASQPEPACR